MATQKSQLAPTSYGTLGKLPREVRDRIYEFLLCSEFKVCGSGCGDLYPCFLEGDDNLELWERENAILRLSKAISTEAMHTLYSNTRFVFSVNTWRDTYSAKCEAADPNRIMNVIVAAEILVPDHVELVNVDAFFHHITKTRKHLLPLCNDAISRNTCEIRLWLYNREPSDLLLWTISEFNKTHKRLTGFRRVRVRVRYSSISRMVSTAMPSGEAIECSSHLAQLRSELEPSLGPASYIIDEQEGHKTSSTLEFCPRDFKASKANNDAKQCQSGSSSV